MVKKLFWTVVILLSAGAFGMSFHRQVVYYLQFHVNTDLQLEPQKMARFPAVTVCNMCPVKKSALHQSPTLKAALGNSRKKREAPHSRKKRSYPVLTCNAQTIHSQTCYTLYHSNDKYNYDDAKTRCGSVGMDLAIMDSASAIAWQNSQNSLELASSDSAWIGIKKISGQYVWEQTSQTVSFNRWDSGQPDNAKECVTLDRSVDYKWKTNNCTEEHLVFCRQTTVPSTIPTTETTSNPSTVPANESTTNPSTGSFTDSTTNPSTVPTTNPSTVPTNVSTTNPSTVPTTNPSTVPTTESTTYPSTVSTTDSTMILSTSPITEISTNPTSSLEPPGPQPIPGSKFPERIQTRESFQLEEEVTEILADLPEYEKEKITFTKAEFILMCKFDGTNCTEEDISSFYNAVNGKCYTFNSGWTSTRSLHNTTRTGRQYGLSMILNLAQDEYLESLADSAGVRVVIHEQTKMPHPEEEGILATPGYVTSVGVKKVEVSRLRKPYDDCRDPSEPQYDLNVYEEVYPVRYSTMACYKTCYQRHVIRRCGCADSLVPKFGQAFGYVDVNTCDIRNITEDDCRYETDKLYRENKVTCDCPRSCKESAFIALPTRILWPADAHVDYLEKILSGVAPNLFNQPNDTNKYQRNLVKVEVYYQDLNYQQLSEVRAYEEVDLLSDIGGLLGLLAGFTVMTVFEFIEFLMDLFVLPCIRRKKVRCTDVTSPVEFKMRAAMEATAEKLPTQSRRSSMKYRPSYIRPSALTRQDHYAGLFDLNH